MTKFHGGPYDGQDLPVDPDESPEIALPDQDQINLMLRNPAQTTDPTWPHLYRVDYEVTPPVFRFVRSQVNDDGAG